MSRRKSIPDPGNTLQELRQTVWALKEIVEGLTGLRDRTLGVRKVYVQRVAPDVSVAEEGDLWINTDTKKLAWYDGRTWEAFL